MDPEWWESTPSDLIWRLYTIDHRFGKWFRNLRYRMTRVSGYNPLEESCFSKWDWGPYEQMFADKYWSE